MGFDDIPAAAFSQPPPPTFAQDYRAAGERLVDTLVRQIGNLPSDARILPGRPIVRESS